MPAATRLTDLETGHDACAPVPLVTSSFNVLINGLGAGRKTDMYAPHGCVAHPPHPDMIIAGSSTVLINGLPAAREGDAVSMGASVMVGSPDVIIGG